MSFLSLIRWGGLAAIFGGTLLVIADLLVTFTTGSSDTYTPTPVEQVAAVLFLAGKLLIVVGLVGLYLYQIEAAGVFGRAAFIAALIGTTLMVSSDWSEVFIAPILQQETPALVNEPPTLLMVGFLLNYGLETLGWLLFGLVTLRARVFPRPAAALLIIGVLLPFTGIPWSFVAWNAAIAWMGLIVVLAQRGPSAVERSGTEALLQAR
jgi:hypothetical protein